MISFRDFLNSADNGAERTPHPWQEALAARLAAGEPPRAIVVPTGGGKTVTIEALLWALAVQADRSPIERTVGVRTVWAIDRRILVDEVHTRATYLADRLAAALGDAGDDLHEMARRLSSLAGGSGAEPLRVTRWRGGVTRESRGHHPFQPEIITSTVAQIGSSLLFRGYGVGERSLALEAGLAAVDTTICLDEAHLAEPFRQTIDAIRAIRDRETMDLPGLRAITLTATPAAGVADADVHGIGDADRAALGPRLTGEKVARLVEPASDRAADHVAALLDAVSAHLDAGASTIACVVNTVRTATEVEAALSRRRPDVDRALLVGPQRPADRERLLAEYRARLFERAITDTPLVCVATQTFEVGLDADVDALVTQSASASAIVQRLGRLNRAGAGPGRATIVRDTLAPLYEEDEPPAWQWLRSLERPDGTLDVSVAALMDDATRPAVARLRSAPGLTPDVVELLVQTAPRPARMADPDVEVFLRGAEEQPSTDVGLCWRCDLRIDDDLQSGRSYRQALLRLVPPGGEEIVTVSIARALTLLRALRAPRAQLAALGRIGLDTPDVEGGDEGDVVAASYLPTSGRDDMDAPRRLVVLRGRRELFEVTLDGSGDSQQDSRLRDIRPGDVLVLPSRAGGYTHDALAPASHTTVNDVAADLRAARDTSVLPAALRLSEEVLREAGQNPKRVLSVAQRCDKADGSAGLDTLCELLGPAGRRFRDQGAIELLRITEDAETHLGDIDPDDDPGAPFGDLDEDRGEGDTDEQPLFENEDRPARPAFVLVARSATTRSGPAATPEEIRPASKPPPTLDEHAAAVAKRAGSFIAGSGLPEPVAAAIVLAARAHDHGKGDPRFQAFFRGGVPASIGAPIAKSVFGTADVQAGRAARSAAGLPSGLRHEIASVAALAEAVADGGVDGMPDEVDAELALHLVATHHGLGRPVPRVPSTL
ncbi:MAG: type I-U CRISPR-associated helicase/endonuclease Cas3, partial [Actinomycetota bacterium]|nr:type I-U CRISPR-associated helicase/endonuclease Cas3 [Actinomycetota bacterium]